MAGQGAVMQAKWGSHGDYEIVAYAPWLPQEIFDLTILAFNVADRFRVPVIILSDEVIGHMVERLSFHQRTRFLAGNASAQIHGSMAMCPSNRSEW